MKKIPHYPSHFSMMVSKNPTSYPILMCAGDMGFLVFNLMLCRVTMMYVRGGNMGAKASGRHEPEPKCKQAIADISHRRLESTLDAGPNRLYITIIFMCMH